MNIASEYLTRKEFDDAVANALVNPWTYLSMSAAALDEGFKFLAEPARKLQQLADDAANNRLSEAARKQLSAEIFQRMAADCTDYLTDRRDRLEGAARRQADAALHHMGKAAEFGRLAQQSAATVADLTTFGKALGGIVSAIQLADALQKDNLNEVAKTATGLTVGLVAGVFAAFFGVPALGVIGLALVTGFVSDVAWDVFVAPKIDPRATFWDRFFDAFTGKDVAGLRSKVVSASQIRSPIVLDLDSDGVETTSVSSGVQFDHAGDGFAERTGWVGRDDGLLVRDLDGNGQIDSGRELFGSETRLASGGKAANGFIALAELDSNGNGRIDAGDAQFNTLRVWQDANGDGISQASELRTLSAAGVQSIATGYSNSSHVDAQGNQHRQVGSYTTTSGQSRKCRVPASMRLPGQKCAGRRMNAGERRFERRRAMAATAAIHQGRRSDIEYLLTPVQKEVHKEGRER